jgi:hypothetical protein
LTGKIKNFWRNRCFFSWEYKTANIGMFSIYFGSRYSDYERGRIERVWGIHWYPIFIGIEHYEEIE